MRWYIDALDPRAGLVFATKRVADLHEPCTLSTAGTGPTFFIGPPSFMPERVARTVGFAMARIQGELGVFIEKQELPFGSLAEITEFTRRMYLGGAAGDGPDENGTPPPPEGGEPPPGMAELQRGMERGGPTADHIAGWLAMAGEMRSRSTDLTARWQSLSEGMLNDPNGPTIDFSLPVTAPPPLHPSPASQVACMRTLARGALRALQELYRRQHDACRANRLSWFTSLHRFAAIATRMGLWPLMRRELNITSMFDTWVKLRDAAQPDSEFQVVFNTLLFGDPLSLNRWSWPLPIMSLTADPFEDLAMLPVPPRTVPFAQRDGQNLQSLLSATVAMPNKLFDPASVSEERAELVLFAAACLNLGDKHLPLWLEQDDINDYFVQQLANRAYTWITQNSPKFVYSQYVESLIAHTPRISPR